MILPKNLLYSSKQAACLQAPLKMAKSHAKNASLFGLSAN